MTVRETLLQRHTRNGNPSWLLDCTLPELLEAAETPHKVNRRNWEPYRKDPEAFGDSAFFGHLGRPVHDSARKLVQEGWPEGGEHMAAFMDALRPMLPPPQSIRRRQQWTDQGDEIDVARVYGGQLDTAWRRTMRRTVQAPQNITLVAQWGSHWQHKFEQLLWTGALTAALADLLGDAGYNVAVQGLMYSSFNSGEGCFIRCTLKDFSEPMRGDSIATVLAHCGVFRTLGFLALRKGPYDVGRYSNRWDRSMDEGLRVLAQHGEADEGAILVPQALTKDAAMWHALDILKRFAGRQDESEA